MNTRSLRILEYDKIIDSLTGFATSEPGRLICRALLPETDLDKIVRAQKETTDASSRIFAKGNLSFTGLFDIRSFLKSLEVGSSLSAVELLEISSLLAVCINAIRYNAQDEDSPKDSLYGRFSALVPVHELKKEIDRCIIDKDEISDDASPELKDIRRHIKNINNRIKSELSHILNGSERAYLQEAVITMREGRYCVPVKAEYRSQISGMIHDQSNTGSTFFIEPMSVVKLNNELREYGIKESDEIARILAGLSALAANYTADLLNDFEILSELDFIFAKARLSHSYKGSEPVITGTSTINIKKGRHPLIDAKKVVPIDIYLGDKFRELIITGPNTGGKTVTLKTIGLFTLMGQAGLHIPAADNSSLTMFNDVFADIGDEQSIEQSLSTFSSHMKNITYILENADERSLVLFDELCAGTDPTEGAALAIAILNFLKNLRITTVATTHYSEIKIYALSNEGVENACCEFDVASLSPTYRLLIGIPGKSNAFAISKKLGLDEHIIEDARANIGVSDKAFEDVISDLEKSRVTIEKERAQTELYKKEIEVLKNQLKVKNERLDEKSESIIEKAKEEACAILREAKETADETIRLFNKAAMNGMTIQDMEAGRERIRKQLENNSAKKTKAKKADNVKHSAADFHIGDKVHVISMDLDGTVHTLPDAKGFLTVSMGILNSKVNIKDLVIIEEASEAEKLKNKNSGIGKLKMSKTASISTEINLIGMTADEAIIELDKYLDDAFLAHLSPVRVVHGKGAGILRNAVHNYLKRQKHVKSYRLGSYGEGDYGVTIVEFKE